MDFVLCADITARKSVIEIERQGELQFKGFVWMSGAGREKRRNTNILNTAENNAIVLNI